MAGDIAQKSTRTFPRLSPRVADLQALVREHTAAHPNAHELVGSLSEAGLDAALDTSAPDGACLVRVQDGDLALLFEPATAALVIVDVRRHAA